MNSTILSRKVKITKNKEEIVDLTTGSIQYPQDNPGIIKEFLVGDDFIMRPDLLAKIAFGSTDYFDLILKFNAISNPYALDSEDFITIPELSFLLESLTIPQKNKDEEDVLNQYLDDTKGANIDPKRLAYNQQTEKSMSTMNSNILPLPPNLAQPGQKEGKFINDKTILLGADITGKTTNK